MCQHAHAHAHAHVHVSINRAVILATLHHFHCYYICIVTAGDKQGLLYILLWTKVADNLRGFPLDWRVSDCTQCCQTCLPPLQQAQSRLIQCCCNDGGLTNSHTTCMHTQEWANICLLHGHHIYLPIMILGECEYCASVHLSTHPRA